MPYNYARGRSLENRRESDKVRSITASIDSSERTIIKVANDGAPITPEAQEQIFIPFFTTKRDGSGIGLSLSRQIMRAHNGMLDLTRSDEECTEFTMIFK